MCETTSTSAILVEIVTNGRLGRLGDSTEAMTVCNVNFIAADRFVQRDLYGRLGEGDLLCLRQEALKSIPVTLETRSECRVETT